MFDGTNPSDVIKIAKIVSELNDHDNSIIHGRHFSADYCKEIGLNISMLEDDDR